MTVSYLAQGRFSKPYLVIWHPVQHVGAWYDRRLRLRALDVSADLLEFARASSRLVHPWNDLTDIELPAWADNARAGRLRLLLAVRRQLLCGRPGADSRWLNSRAQQGSRCLTAGARAAGCDANRSYFAGCAP